MQSNNNSALAIPNFNKDTKATTKEVLLKYLIYLPLFIITVVIALVMGYLYVKYKSPEYSAAVSVFFPEGSKGNGSTSNEMNALNDVMLYNKRVNLANEIQVLRTKTLMARVVKKLNLNLKFYKKEGIKTTELYNSPNVRAAILNIKDSSSSEAIEIVKDGGKFFSVKNKVKTEIKNDGVIKGNNITIQAFVNSSSLNNNDKYVILWQPVYDAAGEFSGGLVISQPQRDANILNISLNTEVPEKGTDILNSLVQEYNASNNEQKGRLVDYTLNFIDQRIGLMRGELGKVEGAVQSYRQANEIVDQQTQTNAGFAELSQAKAKIDNSEVKMQVINMVKQSISNSKNQPIPTTLGIDDPTLLSLVQQYNQYQFQREEQLKSMPAANPTVKLTEGQIDKFRQSILNNLENIGSSTSQLKQRYLGEFENNRARLNAVPRQERQLVEIGRQQDIKEKLFMFLLQKKEEAAITKASGLSSNASALDPASSSGLISPNSSMVYKIAMILGLLIPILIIYLRELLNDKIITRQDITTKTSTPVIGEISHYAEKKRKLVVGFDDRTVVGEQFRMVRANLPYLTKSTQKKTILVTSTTPNEGKSFCSLNLAAVFAIAGKKTVIVEMDLRKPKIAHSLKIEDKNKGVTYYVSGQTKLEDLPIKIPGHDNLFVVTSGAIPPNPSEILMDEKIDTLFAYLKDNFDCIVIDTAPIGLVSDAKILAKHAECTIYIVRQRITPKKHLVQLNEIYQNEMFPNLSILVNDVKANGANSYYGYGGNYMSTYKYSYGREPETIWQKAKSAVNL